MSKPTGARTIASVAFLVAVLALAGTRSAWAHQDPPGCSGTAVDFSFAAFRANGDPIDLSETVTQCETITYKLTVGKSAIGNPCAFEGGTMTITTPDGVNHNVTPGGGVPCIGGTGACSTTSFSSNTVSYTVSPGDVVGGTVTASSSYTAALSHTGTVHTMGFPKASTSLPLDVMFCATATDCVNSVCDPLLQGQNGSMGNCVTSNVPDSTPCTDTDGNQCTFAGCNGAGTCDQNHVVTVCPPDGNPCTNDLGCDSTTGACIYTNTADSTPCPDTDGNQCTFAGCNGAGTCDQNHVVTVCPPDGNPCTNDAGCDSASGACVYTPVPDSTPCPDTVVDNCTAGCNGFGTCDQQHVCAVTTTTSTSVTTTSSVTTSTTPGCVPTGPEAGHCSDMVDNDCDNLIDCSDPDCLQAPCVGGTQNGQSCNTPALQTTCAGGGGSCPCPPILKDPTTIKFGPAGAHLDRLHSHGRVTILGSVDVAGSEAGWLLNNNNGKIYGVVLPAGSLTANAAGTLFKYKNLAAKTQGGIYKAMVRVKGSSYAYTVESYGDMSKATIADMAIQFYMGNLSTSAIHSESWTRTKSGWRATGIGG